MTSQEIYEDLKAKFGESIIEVKLDAPQPRIRIAADKTKEICFFLRDERPFQFDYLSCLSGIDYNDAKLGVVYHLFSMVHRHKIARLLYCQLLLT